MDITAVTNSTLEEPAIAHILYVWHLLDAKSKENEMINKIRNMYGYPYHFSYILGLYNRNLNDLMLNALNSTIDAKRDYRSPWGYDVSGYTFNPLRMKLMLQVDGKLKGDVDVSDISIDTGYKHDHNKNIHRHNRKKTRVK